MAETKNSDFSESDKKLWHRIKRNISLRKYKNELLNTVTVKVSRCENVTDFAGFDPHPEFQYKTGTCRNENSLNVNYEPQTDETTQMIHETDNAKEHATDESDYESESSQLDPHKLWGEIHRLAVEYQIKHTALNALLVILRAIYQIMCKNIASFSKIH